MDTDQPRKPRKEPDPPQHITKKVVDRLQPPAAGTRKYVWDDQLKGFGIMAMPPTERNPKGVRSYIVQYRIGGRGNPTRRFTIGHHGNPWTADKARERAADVLEMVRKKVDPIDALREESGLRLEKKKIDEELGFSRYADVFLERWVDKRKMRAGKNIRLLFERDLKPWFKDKSILEISGDDIQELFEHIGERSHSSANLAFAWLRKFFNYAVLKKRKHIPISPMHLMPMPYDNGERDRYLSGPEIRYVWEAVGRCTERSYTAIVRMLLLTGQRLREVAHVTWSEIDLDKGIWIIPGARTKNKLDHLVPLSPAVLRILRERGPRKEDRKGLVFKTASGKQISNFGRYKAELDKGVAAVVAEELSRQAVRPEEPMTIRHWVLHDLRRTLATGCQALGVPIVHTEAILNHVTGGQRKGITKVYHLYEYQKEKTAALNLWAETVGAIVSNKEDWEVPLVPVQSPAKGDTE